MGLELIPPTDLCRRLDPTDQLQHDFGLELRTKPTPSAHRYVLLLDSLSHLRLCPRFGGHYILEVSPAARDGIRVGDLIVGIDENTVATVDDLHRHLARMMPESRVRLDLLRPVGGRYKHRQVNVQTTDAAA
ncbi:MAG: hypothetical protein CMJ87_04375 [Planctomycetes bacterium]|nr:hypothetical protein [Planctomycetota bacterium]